MTASELTTRVTRTTAIAVLALALGGAGLAGAPGAVGVLAGGALALGSFRLLAARVAVLEAGSATGWLLTSGLRFVAVAAIAAWLLGGGWAHPLALVAGYSALPVAVVLCGLRAAREEIDAWK
jgi:ATP synthase I chain